MAFSVKPPKWERKKEVNIKGPDSWSLSIKGPDKWNGGVDAGFFSVDETQGVRIIRGTMLLKTGVMIVPTSLSGGVRRPVSVSVSQGSAIEYDVRSSVIDVYGITGGGGYEWGPAPCFRCVLQMRKFIEENWK